MGWRNSPFCCWLALRLRCQFHPISLVLPKETGWSPKEKRLWGGSAPVRFRGPPASPTRVGAATRPLRCPLRGLISSLAPGARGLGWQKSSQVKVFCPAFLQKSGRGPGAEPLDARRSARNPLVLKKRRRGSKGEPSPGVPPLRAAPAARSLTHLHNAGGERAPGGGGTPPLRGVGGTWRGGRWTKERVVEDADPYGGWETGRAPHNMPREHPAPGRGPAERSKTGGDHDGGTSRTPSPTGLVRRRGVGVDRDSGTAAGRAA